MRVPFVFAFVFAAAAAACGGDAFTSASAGGTGGVSGSDTGGRANSGGSAGSGGSSSGGVVGSGDTGGASGGLGGTANTMCTDPDGYSAAVRSTVTGANGNFTDQCVEGELIEYICEVVLDPNCSAPNPSCRQLTGNVISQTISCDGNCVEGTCSGGCPRTADVLKYLETDSNGHAVLQNTRDGRVYECDVSFDIMDSYDCRTNPQVGQTTKVISLGLSGSCAAGTTGNIGTGTETGVQQCTYGCKF